MQISLSKIAKCYSIRMTPIHLVTGLFGFSKQSESDRCASLQKKKLYDFRVWLITRKWVRINVGFLKHDDYDDEAAHDKYLYDCVLHDSL